MEVRNILQQSSDHDDARRTQSDKAYSDSAVTSRPVVLVIGLAFHWAPVGLIGLMVIVLLTALNGITEEHRIGHAFEEALPFTALLVVFFAIVAVIHDQHLFTPVIAWVLTLDEAVQPGMFFLANGLLSAISDNVFVATVYINEVSEALKSR